MNYNLLINEIIFLISSLGFIVCLKCLASPKTAKLGNLIGMISMFAIIIIPLINLPFNKIIFFCINSLLGIIVGIILAKKIKMTAMPQMVAFFNGLGGLASALVSILELINYYNNNLNINNSDIIISFLGILIGAITFSGSIIAYLKLQELITSNTIIMPFHTLITVLLFLINFILIFIFIFTKNILLLNYIIIFNLLIALILGILLVIPIGGADMPVVISLLNSYSGIAASIAGFLINNKILIISGSLVGASGIILTRLMCQAMNRSLFNVVFGAFFIKKNNEIQIKEEQHMKEYQCIDGAIILNNSENIIIIPGYGLAVSQAQHNIKELTNILKSREINVKFAIHPVAGRMPGHMNVLLAEADIPYEILYDLDEINSEFENTDTVLIIGANDVVNPIARTDKNSPLFGMPILNADKAKNIIVFKRGKGKGFSGVENPLFVMEKTGTIFGDAKKSLINLTNEIKNL